MKRLALLLPLLALALPLNSTAESYGFFTETVEISPATETDYGFWLREEYSSILKNYSFSCSFPLELESRKFVAAKFIGLSDETRTAGLRGPYGGYGIRDLRERAIEIEMHSRVVGDVFGECTFDVKSNETARCYLVLCYTAPDNTGFIVDDECDFYMFPLRTYASERPAYRILSLVPHFCQPDHLRDFYVPSQREKWDEREKDALAALEKARAAETRPDVSEQLQLLQRKWTRLFEIRAKRKPRPEDPATPSPAEDDLTDAVRAKLDRIIVEKVEWQQKNIADAIADLGDFSRQFDPETDIRKRGVGFTLDLGEAPSEADLPRLTVRLHRVTLHSLLDLVADMADLEYRIEGGRVVLRRKDAKRAELAASAREEDNDEKVQAFLRRIEEPGVIPELEWRDASVADVAQLLTDCSPILNPGTFEERGGVHFVTDADREDFPKGAVPRVSCRAGEVSLLQAAHLAAEAAGWRASAYPESRAIRIGFSWSCSPVYSMADATPELVAAIERELPAAENPDESARLRSFLAARGVRWSESDEAQLRSDIGKLVFTVAEEDTARLIRAILAAPGFALRRIPVRAKVVSIEGDPTRFGLGGRDSALTIRTLSTEDLAEIAAAFDAGAEVTALEPLQAEEGLPAIWKQVSSPAPGFEALVVLTPAADGEGRRVHFVLRSFPPDADAETVAPHGCAGDASLGPGEALLVGAIPVAGAPDRSLALLLEFPDTQSPEEEKTHAENAEPKPLSLAAKLQP